MSLLFQKGHNLPFTGDSGDGVYYEDHYSKISLLSSYIGVWAPRKRNTEWYML